MRWILAIGLLFCSPGFAEQLRDYKNLSHKIVLLSLRAGNHDPKGDNKYYAKVLLNTLTQVKQKKVDDTEDKPAVDESEEEALTQKEEIDSEEVGEFSDVDLEALSYWQPDPKQEVAITIDGSDIRSMVSRAMKKYQVGENAVFLRVDVEYFVRSKKYFFLNDDKKIATLSYKVLNYLDAKDRIVKTALNHKDNTGMAIKLELVSTVKK